MSTAESRGTVASGTESPLIEEYGSQEPKAGHTPASDNPPNTNQPAQPTSPFATPDFEQRVLEQLAELNRRFAQRIAEDGAKNQLIRSVQASLQERDERASGEAYRTLFREVLGALDRLLEQEPTTSLNESVADEIVSIFEIRGLSRIDERGKFDPVIHEISGVVPAGPDYPAGTVVSVEREGYMLGDRTLRPARVIVARDLPVPDPAPGTLVGSPESTSEEAPQVAPYTTSVAVNNDAKPAEEDDRTIPLPIVPLQR